MLISILKKALINLSTYNKTNTIGGFYNITKGADCVQKSAPHEVASPTLDKGQASLCAPSAF